MERPALPDRTGMLFDFGETRMVTMWMANTPESLDMIFIRADGRIMRIAENTETESTAIIGSEGLALAVLDVQARDAVPAAYRHPLVLCRADQHVVWRGEAVPADAAALVAVLRGAGVKPAEARTPAPAAVLETEPHG